MAIKAVKTKKCAVCKQNFVPMSTLAKACSPKCAIELTQRAKERKLEFNGKKLSVDEWKLVFVSAHAIATGKPAEMVIGLEGEVINLRESTAQMSVKRLSSLIEYIHAYCADKGMVFEGKKQWGQWK